MSSLLPFVVVIAALAITASVALGEGPQPATAARGVRRATWKNRIETAARWSARSVGRRRAWLVALIATAVASFRRRRAERSSARDAEAQTAPQGVTRQRSPNAERTESKTQPKVTDPSAPEGVLTTALLVKPDLAIGTAAGDRLDHAGPGTFARVRSALGLAALIVVLGLGLAALLGTVVAVASAAMDGFVN